MEQESKNKSCPSHCCGGQACRSNKQPRRRERKGTLETGASTQKARQTPINSGLPVVCWCLVNDRNQSISPGCHLTKNEPRFEFSTPPSPCFLLSCLFVARVWIRACLKTVLWFCESVRPCFCVFVCVCVSWYACLYRRASWMLSCESAPALVCVLNAGLFLSFHEQHRKHHVGEVMRDILTVLQEIKSLAPNDPDNKQY